MLQIDRKLYMEIITATVAFSPDLASMLPDNSLCDG